MWLNYLPYLTSPIGAIRKKSPNCPFCPLILKTKCWFHDPTQDIFVVTDLNNRGYKYRLLAVGSGKKWHRSWLEYSEEEKNLIIDVLKKVVQEHQKKHIGKLVNIDTTHFSIKEHGHAQANMK